MLRAQSLGVAQNAGAQPAFARSFLAGEGRVASSSRAAVGARPAPAGARRTSRRATAAVKAVLERPTIKYVADNAQSSRAKSSSVLAIILGGGAGTRLYPLTKNRAKPAVPIGGAYRLIDVPMSNCINSGVSKIYVLTQFNSTSLNRHLGRTYNTVNGKLGGDGFVEVLAATQTPDDKEWFQGTADAVRQYSWLIGDTKNKSVEDVVILSGDHLYRMDYMRFVDSHRANNADITVGCIPCGPDRAADFGLMKIDGQRNITSFAEKPKGAALEAMKVDTTVLGISAARAKEQPYIASMGIYVFKKSALLDLLNKQFPEALDFGGEIIPQAAKTRKVVAYAFDGYWEDIGTIKSFFEENLKLARVPAPFEFYDPQSPIYTSPRFLPPAKVEDSKMTDCIVSHGANIRKSTLRNCIIGVRSNIARGAHIEDAMIIGADYYETEDERAALLKSGGVPIGVGENTVISNAIADKNARIGKNVVISNKEGVQDANCEDKGYIIRSGIVVIMRNATIPDGTVI